MIIQQNISLKNKNTLGIECIAEYYCEIYSKEDLLEALAFVKTHTIPLRFLGLGSNVLLPSSGLKGFTAIMKYQVCSLEENTVTLGAGNILGKTIIDLAKQNFDLSGLAGYPSTIGGAVRGNAGLLGVSIGDFLQEATMIDTHTGQIETWTKEQFQFSYRHSALKEQSHLIFWEGIFEFPQGENILEKLQSLLAERAGKQPQGKSAGSFFKNPLDDPKNLEKWSAGYLIDQCGLKGARIGGAQISEKHANFFLNIENATSEDFLELIEKTQKAVFEKFGVKIEPEIQIF